MKRYRLLLPLALVAAVVAACTQPPEPVVLTAVINGNGTIEVGAPVNATLSASKLKTTIDKGTAVTLEAVADNGWSFTGWGTGACSGTSATCKVTMDAAKTVTANFTQNAPDTFTVTIGVTGNGTVGVVADGVDLGPKVDGDTIPDIATGTEVVLTATPGDGNTSFTQWTGDACGTETTATCTITVTADTTVGVEFTTLGNFNLTIDVPQGLGSGSISDGDTIACDYVAGDAAPTGTCTASLTDGTAVTLTATPDGTSGLLAWDGCTPGTDPNTCTLTLSADTTVTARFVLATAATASVTITEEDDNAEEFLEVSTSPTYPAANDVVTGTGFTELTYSTRWSSDQAVGLRFPNVNIPVGAVIDSAVITFTSNPGTPQGTADADALSINVYGEKAVNALQFLDTADAGAGASANVTNRLANATDPIVWDIAAGAWADDSTHDADVTGIVSAITDLDGWDPAANAIAFVLQNAAVGTTDVQTGIRLVDNSETAGGSAPTLTVTYR